MLSESFTMKNTSILQLPQRGIKVPSGMAGIALSTCLPNRAGVLGMSNNFSLSKESFYFLAFPIYFSGVHTGKWIFYTEMIGINTFACHVTFTFRYAFWGYSTSILQFEFYFNCQQWVNDCGGEVNFYHRYDTTKCSTSISLLQIYNT